MVTVLRALSCRDDRAYGVQILSYQQLGPAFSWQRFKDSTPPRPRPDVNDLQVRQTFKLLDLQRQIDDIVVSPESFSWDGRAGTNVVDDQPKFVTIAETIHKKLALLKHSLDNQQALHVPTVTSLLRPFDRLPLKTGAIVSDTGTIRSSGQVLGKRVRFNKLFQAPPTVVAAVQGGADGQERVAVVGLNRVTSDGFDFKAAPMGTWDDLVYSWVAVGQLAL